MQGNGTSLLNSHPISEQIGLADRNIRAFLTLEEH
jgi:hypothetical protein